MAHRPGGRCVDPANLGMTLDRRRAYDCWGTGCEDDGDELA